MYLLAFCVITILTYTQLLSKYAALKQGGTNTAVQQSQIISALREEFDTLRQELEEKRQSEESVSQGLGDAPMLAERLAPGGVRPPASFLSV